MTPVRIKLSRAKGFNLQLFSQSINGLPAAKVDRTTPFGNPFIVGRDGTREECVRLHKLLLAGLVALTTKATPAEQQAHRNAVINNAQTMRGKNLACWCHGSPCHADTLLEVFNQCQT